jgi:predicted ATP-grasp superfamily ATP-dependent carboligase
VRSLNRYGVPVDLALATTDARIRSSEIREFIRVPSSVVDPSGFVNTLRDFIIRNGHDMLVPVDDLSLAAIVDHYDDFKDLLHIGCPPPHITRLVLNKASTLELAEKCGIPVPKTVLISNSEQLTGLVRDSAAPLILKPAEKLPRTEEFKTCVLSTVNDVRDMFPAPREFSPPMLLQEYCPGVGVGVEILRHKGENLAVFQHRRLKELPYQGGFAVTAVAESPDPALVRSSSDLLGALQWEGIAMVEYRVDSVDGRAVLMEVNGRYWGSISLPVIAGIDFPLYQWKMLHGERTDVPSTYAVGTKWRWTVGYIARLHGLLAMARHSASAREALLLTLKQLPEDFGPVTIDSLFTVSDPMPAMLELLLALKALSLYDVKALFKRFYTRPH